MSFGVADEGGVLLVQAEQLFDRGPQRPGGAGVGLGVGVQHVGLADVRRGPDRLGLGQQRREERPRAPRRRRRARRAREVTAAELRPVVAGVAGRARPRRGGSRPRGGRRSVWAAPVREVLQRATSPPSAGMNCAGDGGVASAAPGDCAGDSGGSGRLSAARTARRPAAPAGGARLRRASAPDPSTCRPAPTSRQPRWRRLAAPSSPERRRARRSACPASAARSRRPSRCPRRARRGRTPAGPCRGGCGRTGCGARGRPGSRSPRGPGRTARRSSATRTAMSSGAMPSRSSSRIEAPTSSASARSPPASSSRTAPLGATWVGSGSNSERSRWWSAPRALGA